MMLEVSVGIGGKIAANCQQSELTLRQKSRDPRRMPVSNIIIDIHERLLSSTLDSFALFASACHLLSKGATVHQDGRTSEQPTNSKFKRNLISALHPHSLPLHERRMNAIDKGLIKVKRGDPASGSLFAPPNKRQLSALHSLR